MITCKAKTVKSGFAQSSYVLLACGLFAFVLCSCAPQGGGILGSSTSFSTQLDSATTQAPFAFDITPDTISYNSCNPYSTSGGDSSTLKAFKIGANQGFTDQNGGGLVQGGLKIKTEFLQYVGRK